MGPKPPCALDRQYCSLSPFGKVAPAHRPDPQLDAFGVRQRPAAAPANAMVPELGSFQVFLLPSQVPEKPIGDPERVRVLFHPVIPLYQFVRLPFVYESDVPEPAAGENPDKEEVGGFVVTPGHFECNVLAGGGALDREEGFPAVKELGGFFYCELVGRL